MENNIYNDNYYTECLVMPTRHVPLVSFDFGPLLGRKALRSRKTRGKC